MSEKLIYVRATVRTWNEFEVCIDGWQESIKLSDNENFKSSGFLEVYKNLEDFKAIYPDEDPLIMTVFIKN